MRMRAIEIVLTAVYKLTGGHIGAGVKTGDVVSECNKIMAVVPMSEGYITDLLGDLNAVQAVIAETGGTVQLTPHGKNIVDSSGYVDYWKAFENWLQNNPPK